MGLDWLKIDSYMRKMTLTKLNYKDHSTTLKKMHSRQ